jgi:hypothetical protein
VQAPLLETALPVSIRRLKAGQLQAQFIADILGRGRLSKSQLRPGGRLSDARALGVYQDGYRARLVGALESTYECVALLLGPDVFVRECKRYIDGHPSKTYNLNEYGGNFPQFLKRRYPRKPHLFVMAQLEKEILRIFNLGAPEGNVIDFANINATTDGFTFHPGVALHRFPYRVYYLWSNRKKITKGFLPRDFATEENLLIFRRNDEVYFSVLTTNQFKICARLIKGSTLEKALAFPPREAAPDPKEIQSLFATLASPGVVSAISKRTSTK